MQLKNLIPLLFLTFSSVDRGVIAQSDFYHPDTIREIKIYFEEPNWDELLDSLYAIGDNDRLKGDVKIDGVLYEDAGIRFKGFSSYGSNRVKNPFNISLDHFVNNQEHQGFNKIKLSNVIQDPSFVREVLSYEIARKYMPASEANFANVYVNDTLIGLYTNVESVNRDFTEKHFSSRDNSFFKCNPESLDLNGENSNLSDTPGDDLSAYYPLYKQESENSDDWQKLKNLIDSLALNPSDLESILNVDEALWMHAFNYSVINFDSYSGYAQNYYLYEDAAGLFNPILWDMNMSFGSFRLTDASDNWDGFSIAEAKTLDPLAHFNSVSVFPKPLMRRLFEIPIYRRMYLAHIRTIVEENFFNQDYANRAAHFQTTISASVLADTNKFYSNTDFTDNLNSTVSDLVDYPGITDLIDDRAVYLSNYPGYQGAPTISLVNHTPSATIAGDDVWINATVAYPTNTVLISYRYAKSVPFSYQTMFDDGLHNDGAAGDGEFGIELTGISNLVEHYVYAENDSTGRFSPERAAYEFYTIESDIAKGDLAINEIMAANRFMVYDQNGEFDDWLELFNTANYAISTKELYLSDESNDLQKWSLPLTSIEPGEFFTVWMDDDNQFGVHANFELDKDGDSLWLSDGNGNIIDSLFFGQQFEVSSYGRYPNGTGSFVEMTPSFGEINSLEKDAVLEQDIFIYPNPAADEIYLNINTDADMTILVTSMDGRRMKEFTNNNRNLLTIDSSQFADGMYLLHFIDNDLKQTEKVLIKN